MNSKVHCLYMIGLGNLGLKKFTIAQALFSEVLAMDAMDLGARTHAAFIQTQKQDEMIG